MSTREVSLHVLLLHAIRDAIRISVLCAALVHFMSPLLTKLLSTSLSARATFVLATLVVHEGIYYGMNGIILLCDRLDWLSQYKIPRKHDRRAPPNLVVKTLKSSAVPHWIIQPISLYALFPLFEYFGTRLDGPPPSYTTIVMQIAVSVFINDAVFYWTHRLLHLPSLYKRFHKQHHEYTATTGFAAEYASPLEQILSNQLPTVLGPLLLGMHVHTWIVYLAWRLWRTYELHSGYNLSKTWLGSIGLFNGYGALYHDFHHTSNRGNYGGPGNAFWDLLCGTQDPSYSSWLRKNNISLYHDALW